MSLDFGHFLKINNLNHPLILTLSHKGIGEKLSDIEKAQEVEHLGSWIYHPTDPSLLTCSRELCRIFGLRENEFDGRMESFFTLVHPEDREAVERASVTAIVDNIPYSLEHRIVRPDGSVRWVHAQADIIRDAEGQRVQIIGIIQDITERREVKERVRRSERRYHTLVHASPVGIFHTDAQGECIYVNERWCELTGLKAEEACGAGWTRALHPGDRERIATEWYAVAKQHRLFQSVYRFLRPDGRIIWVYGQAAGEESETGEIIGYVETVTDVTEQKQIEQRLLQQQSELCHAQRLITIGELAGIMAHELSQPLGAIANYLEGATIRYEKEFTSNPELGKVLEHTLRLAAHATQVVRNIRALVRRQDPSRQGVDINALIRETVQLIGAEVARKRISITLDLALNIRPLWGHRVYLQQLLLNLILNGMEAMEAIDTNNRWLTIQTLGTDRAIEIRITDTGVGFGEELATRLFEPFITTKKEGVGLGLSICRTIVEAHGGGILADSRPGQGATFRVTLPTDRRSHERDPNRADRFCR
jgi:PAS domain S-box-containing protein